MNLQELDTITITAEELDQLPEYQDFRQRPLGMYPGRRWKVNANAFFEDEPPEWIIREFYRTEKGTFKIISYQCEIAQIAD